MLQQLVSEIKMQKASLNLLALMSHLIHWIVPLINSGGVQERAISVRQSVLADAVNISHGTSSPVIQRKTRYKPLLLLRLFLTLLVAQRFNGTLIRACAVELAQYVAGENVKYQICTCLVTNQMQKILAGCWWCSQRA